MEKYYISTPIYYCNAKPHLGHLYSTLYAYFLVSYYRNQGKEVLFVTGSDQHGSKIAAAAQKVSLSPKVFIAKETIKFKKLWNSFGINFDNSDQINNHFLETDQNHHHLFVQKQFLQLQKQGEIYQDFYEGWYCKNCENFQTQTNQTKNSSQKNCSDCGATLNLFQEKNFFLKVTEQDWEKLQTQIKIWKKTTPSPGWFNILPQNWKEFTKILPLSLTRNSQNVEWGIKTTDNQTIYVWFDALWSYISALPPYYQKLFWENSLSDSSSQNLILHILGKEIIKFHLLFWPLFLLKLNYKLPNYFLVHGWLLNEGKKMSKSSMNGFYLNDIVSFSQKAMITNYKTVLKLFLAFIMRPNEDINFGLNHYQDFYQNYLVNKLGNFCYRVTNLIYQAQPNFAKINLLKIKFQQEDQTWKAQYQNWIQDYHNAFNSFTISQAIKTIFQFIDFGNLNINQKEAWKLKTTNPDYFVFLSYHWLLIMKLVAKQLIPFSPELSLKILFFYKKDFNLANLKELDENFSSDFLKKIVIDQKPVKLF